MSDSLISAAHQFAQVLVLALLCTRRLLCVYLTLGKHALVLAVQIARWTHGVLLL